MSDDINELAAWEVRNTTPTLVLFGVDPEAYPDHEAARWTRVVRRWSRKNARAAFDDDYWGRKLRGPESNRRRPA